MVTRTPASIASVLFCAVAASGMFASEPRPVVRPSAQSQTATAIRPASAVVMRTERRVTHALFSTTTTVRSFTVLRPAQTVVISPRESSAKGERQ